MTSKKDQDVYLRDLGEYLKSQRLIKGITQGRLAEILGYSNKQLISEIERGNRKIPLDREKIEKYANALGLSDKSEFLLRLVLASIPPELHDWLLGKGQSLRSEGKLDDDERVIIWLKRQHDRFSGSGHATQTNKNEERMKVGVERRRQDKIRNIIDQLREMDDEEVLVIEKQTLCFRGIIPDLKYELQPTYYTAIKDAYKRKARYEYLLPATKEILKQYEKYKEIFGTEINRMPELFKCRFIRLDEWQGLEESSGYYSGRMLYDLKNVADPIGIEYDRKRSTKNFLMTNVETKKFKREFDYYWESEETLKDVDALTSYLGRLEKVKDFLKA